ncbi:HlyD family secretion protein [Microbulbifer sediminum]|uniref:HlyD family secretion protein n=1 Tax=Microbulbifer sediminum TaxID=2904250 RepID=UPI001F344012|nr:HlyD family secretion protein [Microbulbifer sediminum]
MNAARNYLFSGLVLLLAMVVALLAVWKFLENPWTRNGQVRAWVIQVTPNVTGQVVDVPVSDNQYVQRGALLFQIDPRPFETELARARAEYDKTGDSYLATEQQVQVAAAQVEAAEAAVWQAESAIKEIDAEIEKSRAELQRQRQLLPQRATSRKSLERAQAEHAIAREKRKGAEAKLAQARASLDGARADLEEARARLGTVGEANASIRAARAAVRQAELNLEFSRVTAPVDGYITNLRLRDGSQAVANKAALAIVDAGSFWVEGYFKETSIARIAPGDRAVVTLMAYPDRPLAGRVDSISRGISQQDGSTGNELLPAVSPTFDWIRLAQRVPVKIVLDNVPDDVELRVGITGSVMVKSGTAAREENGPISPGK